jgi:hypothetical protein
MYESHCTPSREWAPRLVAVRRRSARARSPAASNRLTGPALASCRVGENEQRRHHRDTADPKPKRFAEYRHECSAPSAPSPRYGAGQGLAPAVRKHSKCLFINRSRSIDFALLMTWDESGLAALAALRPAIRERNRTAAVLFAASVKWNRGVPVRQPFSAENVQLAPPVRRQASAKLGTTSAKHAATNPNKRNGRPAV